MEERKKQGEKLRTFVGGEEQTEQEAKYSEVLSAIADEHQVDSVTTIAIAYVMQKAPYVFPIIGKWTLDRSTSPKLTLNASPSRWSKGRSKLRSFRIRAKLIILHCSI